MLPSKAGVYAFVLDDGTPAYIGMSSNIGRRVLQHRVRFRVKFLLCDESSARAIEMRLVGMHNPPLNSKLRTGLDGQQVIVKTPSPVPAPPVPPKLSVLLEGFVPIEGLWQSSPPCFPSATAARWFMDQHRDELIANRALAILGRRKYAHLDRVKAAIAQAGKSYGVAE